MRTQSLHQIVYGSEHGKSTVTYSQMKPDTEFDLIMKPKMKQSALRRWRLILEQGGHGNGVKGASGSNHVLSLHVGAGITGVHMRPSLRVVLTMLCFSAWAFYFSKELVKV